MGIFAINSGSDNLKINTWYHFFIEMNKYFHDAKWKPASYELSKNDIGLLFIDENVDYDLSIIPKEVKIIGIVKQLHIKHLKLLERCSYIIFLNPYQKQASDVLLNLNTKSISCPKYPTIDYKNSINIDNFVMFGGDFTYEKIIGMGDRILYMHKQYPTNVEFLIFPKNDDISNIKNELSKLEAHKELKSRIIFVNNSILSYNTLKFRMQTAKHVCLWSNGMPIEMMGDYINEKNIEILDVGINESSMLSLASSGSSNLLLDDEIDYVSHFRCSESFTYKNFSCILKNAIASIR